MRPTTRQPAAWIAVTALVLQAMFGGLVPASASAFTGTIAVICHSGGGEPQPADVPDTPDCCVTCVLCNAMPASAPPVTALPALFPSRSIVFFDRWSASVPHRHYRDGFGARAPPRLV
jgi:hypothetical protein